MDKGFKLGTSQSNLLRALDAVSLVILFAVAAALTSDELSVKSLSQFMAVRISLGNLFLFGAFVIGWYVLFSGFGLYEPVSGLRPYKQALDVVKATSIGTLMIVLAAVVLNVSFVSGAFIIVLWLSTSAAAIVVRIVARVITHRFGRASHRRRKVLIVGANPRSLELARTIESQPSSGFDVLGFVDSTSMYAPGLEKAGFSLVADLPNFRGYLGKTAVDEVLICLPTKSQFDEVASVMAACEEQGVMVGLLRDLLPGRLDYSRILQFNEQTIISVYPHAINGGRATIKRSFDLFVSLLLLLVLSPVFAIVALIIKMTSPGPVFFSQVRVGLNKKRFRMLKFRTMVQGAEAQQRELEALNEAQGPVFKIKHDPRITTVGKYLRKTSLDELPQLINVVRGEMSLVGPRPLPVRDYEGFSEDWHRRRVSVRPGMTGLWQVQSRNHAEFDEWMKLDLQYIDQWSFGLDLKVMMHTLPAVFRGSGD